MIIIFLIFQLDFKILTPEELLYRAVQGINVSHNLVSAQLDVKLRTLIAFGLNEQVCLEKLEKFSFI